MWGPSGAAMESFLLVHILQSGLMSLTQSALEILGALAQQEAAKAENLMAMAKLSDEAKKLLAQEKKNAQAMADSGLDKQAKMDEPGKEADDENAAKRQKNTNEQIKASGSVQRFLGKKADMDDTGNVKKDGTATEHGYVKPKPKHRPVSLTHSVNMEHGALEIFTRCRPHAQNAENTSAHLAGTTDVFPKPSRRRLHFHRQRQQRAPLLRQHRFLCHHRPRSHTPMSSGMWLSRWWI